MMNKLNSSKRSTFFPMKVMEVANLSCLLLALKLATRGCMVVHSFCYVRTHTEAGDHNKHSRVLRKRRERKQTRIIVKPKIIISPDSPLLVLSGRDEGRNPICNETDGVAHLASHLHQRKHGHAWHFRHIFPDMAGNFMFHLRAVRSFGRLRSRSRHLPWPFHW